jgi:hypothetical protein
MAQSKRTAASYIAEQRNTTAGNPFMGKTLAEMKKMYSKMTPKQRGENVETFRRAAAAAAKGSANKSKVTKPVTGTTPARNPQAKSAARKTASAMRSEVTKRQSQKVTDAMLRDANKPKSKPKTTQKPQSSRSGGRRASKVVKTNKNTDLRKTLKNLADQFKTFGTYKDGEEFTVGNVDYISDGKGGVRGSRRRQF